MTPGRQVAGKIARLVLLGVVATWRPGAAQVGHDPLNSPYRDIPLHPVFFVFGGHLSHDRTRTAVRHSFSACSRLPS